MKVKCSIATLGSWLALILVAYQCVVSMQWGGAATSTVVALGMVAVALLALLFLFSKPILRRSVSAALLPYYLYIVFLSIFNGYLTVFQSNATLVFACAFWIFLFWMLEVCGRRQCIKPQTFSIIFCVLTAVCFVLFFQYYNTSRNDTEVQLSGLNVVYYILFMLPIVLMIKNKKVSAVGIAINILAALLSSKRGALIAVLVAVVIWLWTDLSGKVTAKKVFKVFLYVTLGILAFYAAIAIVESMGLDILDRMRSFFSGEDTSGSGRTDIWTEFGEHMRQDTLLHNLFGRGYNSTKLNPTLKGLGMNWAHNEFLQILFDYGVVGLLLFISVIVRLLRTAYRMKKFGYRYHRQFFISIIIFLLCCIYSMITLNPQWFLSMAAFWGYVIGDFERERAVSS